MVSSSTTFRSYRQPRRRPPLPLEALLIWACASTLLHCRVVGQGVDPRLKLARDDVVYAGESVSVICFVLGSAPTDPIVMSITDESGDDLSAGRPILNSRQYTKISQTFAVERNRTLTCTIVWNGVETSTTLPIHAIPITRSPYCKSDPEDPVIVGKPLRLSCYTPEFGPSEELLWNTQSGNTYGMDVVWTKTRKNELVFVPGPVDNRTVFTCTYTRGNRSDSCDVGPIYVFRQVVISPGDDTGVISAGRIPEALTYTCTHFSDGSDRGLLWTHQSDIGGSGISIDVAGNGITVSALPGSSFTGEIELTCTDTFGEEVPATVVVIVLPEATTPPETEEDTATQTMGTGGTSLLDILEEYLVVIAAAAGALLLLAVLCCIVGCLCCRKRTSVDEPERDEIVPMDNILESHDYAVPPVGFPDNPSYSGSPSASGSYTEVDKSIGITRQKAGEHWLGGDGGHANDLENYSAVVKQTGPRTYDNFNRPPVPAPVGGRLEDYQNVDKGTHVPLGLAADGGAASGFGGYGTGESTLPGHRAAGSGHHPAPMAEAATSGLFTIEHVYEDDDDLEDDEYWDP